MPDNGIKFLVARRAQARRRARGRHRGAHGRALGAPARRRRRPHPGRHRPCRRAVRRAPRRHHRRAARRVCASRSTARTVRRARSVPRRCGPPAPTSSSSTPRPTAATSTRSAAPRTPSSCRPPSSPPARTSGSRSTATPTGASPSTRRARWWTATRSWGSSRSRCATAATSWHDTLVTTVMSNLGLKIAMTQAGIATIETAVGDRYVLEAMRAGGYSLGGEQSGHIIMAAHATTGDGVLTALQLAARVAATGTTIADLAGRRPAAAADARQRAGRRQAPRRRRTSRCSTPCGRRSPAWASTGRVLLRSSGTEDLVRVMVEAGTQAEADRVAARAGRRRPATGWRCTCPSGPQWDQALRDVALWIIESGTRVRRTASRPIVQAGHPALRAVATPYDGQLSDDGAGGAARRHAPDDAGRARRRPRRAAARAAGGARGARGPGQPSPRSTRRSASASRCRTGSW